MNNTHVMIKQLVVIRDKKILCMCATSYPPMDYSTVLSAMQNLTTEFGMGSGVPSAPWLRTYKVFSKALK